MRGQKASEWLHRTPSVAFLGAWGEPGGVTLSGVWLSAAVTATALLGVGAGFQNGDAAVYAAQAMRGDLSERSIHLGYLALATALARLCGDALPVALDGVSAVSAGAAVLAVATAGGTMAAALFAISVLPLASFAEVDLVWVALVLWAAVVPSRIGAALLAFAAVTVSPSALLTLPWVGLRRERRFPVALGAGLAVAVLSAISLGGWWIADRGVLHAALDPLRSAGAWSKHLGQAPLPVGLALVMVFGGKLAARETGVCVLALLPLALAPSDVPGWLILDAVAACIGASALNAWPRLASTSLLGLGAFGSIRTWEIACQRIRDENDVIAQVAARLREDDVLVAPWSWGVRVSLAATGDPYGLLWRSPGGFVRDQQARWCAARPLGRIAVLPPGQNWDALPAWERDDLGVLWTWASHPDADARSWGDAAMGSLGPNHHGGLAHRLPGCPEACGPDPNGRPDR